MKQHIYLPVPRQAWAQPPITKSKEIHHRNLKTNERSPSCVDIIRIITYHNVCSLLPPPLHGVDLVPVTVGLAVWVQPVLQELLLSAVLQGQQVEHVLPHGLVREAWLAGCFLPPGSQQLLGLLFRQEWGGLVFPRLGPQGRQV